MLPGVIPAVFMILNSARNEDYQGSIGIAFDYPSNSVDREELSKTPQSHFSYEAWSRDIKARLAQFKQK